ncbi:TetR/AcrR family transcriptional regulator [Mycolicibacterium houstonense]|uniref:TetR/AcrR family transcriptional regulator n=1 Tax=Mycolicibacterium houstonense TaxID=146021 RepID=UPI003F9C7CFB
MAARTDGAAASPQKRTRGRPKLDIDCDAVADAAAELFAEGGYDAVTIVNAADKLAVSRATLYRTVPTKDDLLRILFERSTAQLTARAQDVLGATDDPRERLAGLIRVQAVAAIRMRGHMSVFFESGQLPPDVLGRWRRWSRKYESAWIGLVADNIEAGTLDIGGGDPRVAARLIFGMLISVCRWYRPGEAITPEEVAEVAIRLLGLSATGRRR